MALSEEMIEGTFAELVERLPPASAHDAAVPGLETLVKRTMLAMAHRLTGLGAEDRRLLDAPGSAPSADALCAATASAERHHAQAEAIHLTAMLALANAQRTPPSAVLLDAASIRGALCVPGPGDAPCPQPNCESALLLGAPDGVRLRAVLAPGPGAPAVCLPCLIYATARAIVAADAANPHYAFSGSAPPPVQRSVINAYHVLVNDGGVRRDVVLDIGAQLQASGCVYGAVLVYSRMHYTWRPDGSGVDAHYFF
jgi:hypothetical protein